MHIANSSSSSNPLPDCPVISPPPSYNQSNNLHQPAKIIDKQLSIIAINTHMRLKNPNELKHTNLNPYQALEIIGSSILNSLASKPDQDLNDRLKWVLDDIKIYRQDKITHPDRVVFDSVLYKQFDEILIAYENLLKETIHWGLERLNMEVADECSTEISRVIDHINRFSAMTTDSSNDLVKELVQLTTLITEKSTVNNTLRNNAYLLNASTANIQLANADISALPRTRQLLAATQSAIKARMVIGAKKSNQIDPEQQSLKDIKAIAVNGLQYFESLKTNETAIRTSLADQSNAATQSIENTIREGSRQVVISGTLAGYETNLTSSMPANVAYPTEITAPAGLNPLNSARIIAALKASPDLQINRLISKALENNIGEITFGYTGSDVGASRHYNDRMGHHGCEHWAHGRRANYSIGVYYLLNGQYEGLFTLSANRPEHRIAHQETFYDKKNKGRRHADIGNDFQKRVDVVNAVPLADFLSNDWPNTPISATIQSHSTGSLPDAMKTLINHAMADKKIPAIIAEANKRNPALNGYPAQLAILNQASAALTELSVQPHAAQQDLMLANHLLTMLERLEQAQLLTHKSAQEERFEQEKAELGVKEELVISSDNIVVDKTRRLGEGSFGQVYFGSHKQDPNQHFAVKILHPGSTMAQNEGEVQVALKLNQEKERSPYLAIIHGVCRLEGKNAIVMEYIPNGTVFDTLHKNKTHELPWEIRGRMAGQMCEALNYLHQHEIIHGDLKSGNIMLTNDYNVKFVDFGLSKTIASTQAGSTRARPKTTNHEPAGTFAWRAPELIENESGRVSKESDVWALGMTLFELLTRRLPFESFDGSDAPIIIYWVKLIGTFRADPTKDNQHLEMGVNALPAKNGEVVHDLLIDLVQPACALAPKKRATSNMLLRQFTAVKLPEVKPEMIAAMAKMRV